MLALTLLFACSSGAQMQDSVKQSRDFVSSLDVDCAMDHGYRCVEIEEDSFLEKGSDSRMIPGLFLRAWQVSYADFRSLEDLTEEQKDLRHYKIGLTQDQTHFIVLFQGLLLPEIVDGQPRGTIRSVFGLSTKYWIDKKTMTVSKRLFMR